MSKETEDREVIQTDKEQKRIQMPLLQGAYFTNDIVLIKNDETDEIVIHSGEYRIVKCGRGHRKKDFRSDMISIPNKILSKFIEALQELSKP